jgi:hypothetical protein
MNEPVQKQHLFDNPRNVSLAIGSLYIVCILLFLLDFILHRHATSEWDGFTGFFALFGFIACVTIVLAAKQLRKILKHKENYYDVDD